MSQEVTKILNSADLYEKLTIYKQNVLASLSEIEELDICSKSLLKRYVHGKELVNSTSIIKIQAIIDYMYEQVNIGNWKEVKLYLRKTITIASYLKLLAQINNSDVVTEKLLKESLKTVDFGILFGCPLDKASRLLQDCATSLNKLYVDYFHVTDTDIPQNTKEEVKFESNKYNAIPIDIKNCPSMEHFLRNYIEAEKPVVLDNCISHWPAFSKWNDHNYFIKLAGLRTVSVELGHDYTDSEWTQKLMTIEEFIKNHIYQTNGSTGYLAQYQLFQQIPELKNDIIEPEYCCFSDNDDAVDIMAWYGPKGTISPLHHDPKKNLLAQVVGKKQIFLFSPKDSEFLYPHEHELLNNTARVDPRKPDLEKYPKYQNANAYFCVLHPGQMLYIPPKWWHFVESLSVSFSVSFWWT